MALADGEGALDRRHRRIAVLFNANDEAQAFADLSFAGEAFRLHPLQAASHDPVVRAASFDRARGRFAVPGRTAAVFVAPRPVAERLGLLVEDVEELIARGALRAGRGRALRARLRSALASLGRGHAVGGQLGAFVHQVEAFVRSRHLPAAEGEALIGEAREIMAFRPRPGGTARPGPGPSSGSRSR
jgi:hypothetical protein